MRLINGGGKGFSALVIVLVILALVGYGWALSLMSLVSSENNLNAICTTSACFDNWLGLMEKPFTVAKATSDFLVAVATVGGVLVALLTYKATLRNNSLTNHVDHLGAFQSYVLTEVQRRPRLSMPAVDILKWYNKIFPSSRSGNMSVSEGYLELVRQLADFIGRANKMVQTGAPGTFRFKPHQMNMIDHLAEFGISATALPRIDFYEVEDQVLSLISCVNQSFCYGEAVDVLPAREYR